MSIITHLTSKGQIDVCCSRCAFPSDVVAGMFLIDIRCLQNRWPLLCTLTCRLTAFHTSSGHLGLTSNQAAPSPFPSASAVFPPHLPPLTQTSFICSADFISSTCHHDAIFHALVIIISNRIVG